VKITAGFSRPLPYGETNVLFLGAVIAPLTGPRVYRGMVVMDCGRGKHSTPKKLVFLSVTPANISL
jgi:hypothetical protein